ncbi:MAG: hypothetical protein HZC24_03655 [Rhodocyclales bacterium]|nr:hypothetical protein [Rhodocyclales bacterium]
MTVIRRALPVWAGMALLLSACADTPAKLWPFGSDTVQDRSRAPADAAEYVCGSGKRIYVRTLDGGNAVWLILPDREMRLDKAANGNRYVSGNNALDINGNEASFKDGASSAYAACKGKTAAN